MRLKLKGQGVMEYAFLVAVVVAGLIAMQIYLKRGLQGRLRSSGQAFGETQYSPGRAVSNLSTVNTINTTEDSLDALSQTHTEETRIRKDREKITRE